MNIYFNVCNYILLSSKDIQSRLDLIEKDVEQWKKENQNQNEEIRLLKNKNNNHEEEIERLKTQIEHLIHQQSYEKSTGETTNEDFIRRPSVKRSERSVNKPNAKTATIKPQLKSTAADVSYASWPKLEISDKVIGYMDYDTYTVKIYDHASNKDENIKKEEKKYYFEPIGQLDHLSAKSDFNNVSAVKTPEMVFKVNMWSDTIRNEVHKFISEGLQLSPVNINLVRVLPLDRVMVYNEIDSSPNFEIEQNWIDYKSDRYLKFKYVCEKLEHCDDLAIQMKTNPEQFKLKMRFSLSSQKSHTQDTKLKIESIMHGNMINKLDQKFKGQETILLTADGKKQLLKESSENIIIQTVDDTQIPTKSSQSEIYRRLENMIQFSRTTIQKGDEKAWENVFWNDDNYRPDQSSKTLNELYKNLDQESQSKLSSSFSSSNKVNSKIGGSGWGVKVKTNIAADFSRAGTDSKENLERLFDESKERVEWDGLKFVPKQMELYAMNLARLKNTQAFKDTNVKVSYTTSMLTIDVRHNTLSDSKTSSELFELKKKMSGKYSLINGK